MARERKSGRKRGEYLGVAINDGREEDDAGSRVNESTDDVIGGCVRKRGY